jgi:hypothetical protein
LDKSIFFVFEHPIKKNTNNRYNKLCIMLVFIFIILD